MRKILILIAAISFATVCTYGGTFVQAHKIIEARGSVNGVEYKQFFTESEVSEATDIDLFSTTISLKDFRDKALSLTQKIDKTSSFKINSIQFKKTLDFDPTVPPYWYVQVDLFPASEKLPKNQISLVFLLNGNSGTLSKLTEEILNK